MTTPDTDFAKTSQFQGGFRLPDPPRREPDEMTNYDHVHMPGNSHHLIQHFGNPETTLMAADRWIIAEQLLPGFGAVSRPVCGLWREPGGLQDGYVISVQGKPPDFVHGWPRQARGSLT